MRFILIILLLSNFLKSQTTEPDPLLFNYYKLDGTLVSNQSFNPEYFEQDKFMLGFQWGASLKMRKELLSTAVADKTRLGFNQTNLDFSNSFYDIVQPVLKLDGTDTGGNGWIKNLAAIQFEPTLEIDLNEPSLVI